MDWQIPFPALIFIHFPSVGATAGYHVAGAATYYNVGSVGTPVANTNGNVASTTPTTGPVTTVVGGVLFDAMATFASSGSVTATSPQTAIVTDPPSSLG